MTKKIVLCFSILIAITIAAAYGFLAFGVSKITNNKKIQNFVIQKVSQKAGFNIIIEDLKISNNFLLSYKIQSKKIKIGQDNSDFLEIKNAGIETAPFKLKFKNIQADYIFFDKTKLKSSQKKEKSNKKNFDLNIFSLIQVKKAKIILDEKTDIYIDNIEFIKKENAAVSLDLLIKTKYIDHDITIKSKDGILINENSLLANNLAVFYNKTPLIVNGLLYNLKKEYDFSLFSSNLSAKDVEATFLFFIKQKNNQKNFIENFYDFYGNSNVNLHFKNNRIDGKITIKDFSFKSEKFSIPFKFREAVFNFEDKNITLSSDGFMGTEPLHTDFYGINLYSPEKIIKGEVKSQIDNDLAGTYIPQAKIKGKIDLKVNYFIQNKTPEVEYLAYIPKGSDLYYQKIELGLDEENRRVYAKTIKKGDNLYLDSYDYSTIKDNKEKFIVKGDGLFVKKSGKFNLDFIEIETNDFAPLSVIGPIADVIEKGFFRGKLKYIRAKNLILGTFELKDSKYKNFFAKSASIDSNEKRMLIKARGTYENEPFNCLISIENSFKDKVVINDIELYLRKFTIKRNQSNSKKKNFDSQKFVEKTVEKKWQVKKIGLKLDELTFKNILLENLTLEGLVEDNIAYFSMPKIKFAKGTLEASGIYDFDFQSSDIDFSADNIDSNEASSMVFNLKDQFKGTARAKMHAKTYNKLDFIDANAEFAIIEGALVKFGSGEFIINESNKNKKPITLKLKKIVNVDLDKITALKSDIWGNFDVHNSQINNVELYNAHKFLSIFASGNYNITSQDADLCLFAKYNKSAQKGIKILFVPLSWITKFIFKNENTKDLYAQQIEKIPPIEASKKEQEVVLIKANGNINNPKSLQVLLKNIN